MRSIDLHSKFLVQKYGLTGPQLAILKELDRLTDITIGQIARNVSLSAATVTDIVSRLEKNGLVERLRGESDKRRVYVKATDRALTILRQAPSLLQERFVAEFDQLADWEQTQLLSSLQRVASLMEAPALEEAAFLEGESLEGESSPSDVAPAPIIDIPTSDAEAYTS
jgi:DNA-binding MarR family transcriptional regulator